MTSVPALLLRGGTVLVDEDPPAPGSVRDGIDILVAGGRIAAVGPDLPAPPPPGRVLDARHRLVVPGLVNAHVHSHNMYWRGWFERSPLDFCTLHARGVGAFGAALRLTPRQVYARALLGCVEMLRTGTTTVVDDVNLNPTLTEEHLAAVVQAYEDAGMRAVVAAHVFDLPFHRTVPFVADLVPAQLRAPMEREPGLDLAWLGELVRGAARRFNSGDRRVRFGLGPSGPQRCSDALLTAIARLAEECDLPVYIHLLETRTQAAMGRVAYGHTLVERLRGLGFLSPRVTVGHAVWVTPDDVEILAASGAAVSHAPVSNLKLGSGIAPIVRLRRAGVPVALGTDGVMSNDGLNLFEAMKVAALLPRVCAPDPEDWLDARDVLAMATTAGARAARVADLGRIAVGQRADLVMIDLRRAAFAPRNDLLRQLVYAATGSAVDTVIVDGGVVVEGGRLLTVDEAAVAAEVTADAAAFHAAKAESRGQAAVLDPYFREMYGRCWAMDVGVDAFGPRP